MKPALNSLLFVFNLVISTSAIGQSNLFLDNQLIVSDSTIHSDHSTVQLDQLQRIEHKDFNSGLISDPLLLIQGRMAGLQVYNRGGDPNVTSIARIRGLSSLDGDISPLIVIDGIPASSLQNIDPNDIESMVVHKDAFSKSLYGGRGANGVIAIKRKMASQKDLRLSYIGGYSISKKVDNIGIYDASRFLEGGGLDFGSAVDYPSKISRQAGSNFHGLSVEKGLGFASLRLSGNYRNTEGVLRKSGFESINGNASLAFNLLKDRLKINFSNTHTSNAQQIGFQEAFRYAVSRNPTTPIFAQDSQTPFSDTQFGGYYELIGIFDTYNPVALIHTNDRENTFTSNNFSASTSYMYNDIQIGLTYSKQNIFNGFRQLSKPTSIFLGSAFANGDNIGGGTFIDNTSSFDFLEGTISYTHDLNDQKLIFKGGYMYQEFNMLNNNLTLLGIDNPDLLGVSKLDEYEWSPEGGQITSVLSQSSEKRIAFNGQVSYFMNTRFAADLSLRYEGSSIYSDTDKWHLYPSLRLRYDLLDTSVRQEKLFLYGSLGVMSSSHETVLVPALPSYKNLTEIKKEGDIGLRYTKGKLNANLSLYAHSVININLISLLPQIASYGGLTTTGADLSVGLDLIDNSDFKYKSTINLSTYTTKVRNLPTDQIAYASPGGPGMGSTSLLRIKNDGKFGDIFAPIFAGVDDKGFVIYEDINGDGSIMISLPERPDSDFTTVGNAIPLFEFGWNNNFKIRKVGFNVFFRGAIGHSLINLNRLFYEPRFAWNELFNTVDTDKAIEELGISRYTSLVVENASFLKLDNLSVNYPFYFNGSKRKIEVFLVGQNLFTLTGYSGGDPEPSLYDQTGLSFSPGIDRRTNYRPSKTFTIMVKVDL